MTIESGNGVERLTAEFRNAYLLPLEFQLKPTISVKWATDTDLP